MARNLFESSSSPLDMCDNTEAKVVYLVQKTKTAKPANSPDLLAPFLKFSNTYEMQR